MAAESMTVTHQRAAPWEWLLEPARATRVPAARHPRWLRVAEGRAWLTRTGAGVPGGDVWLEQGQRHRLPAGSEWVVEGWPRARLELLEAAPRRASATSVPRRAWPWLLRDA